MASLRIATFMQGIELWESDVDPNAVVLPIGLGSMCIQNNAGTVRFWLCTALPSTWVNVSAGGSGVPLSSLLAATAVNTIDSLALAQTWNWSTATTQAALSLAAAALTTGTIVDIVNSSAAVNSTRGLLRVINNTATTAGFLARFQSNTGANSGLSILSSGNVGVGIAAPVATFHNAGATVLGNTALGNFAGGGSIGTPVATVEAFSSATIAQTTAAQTLSIDAPSNTTAGRIFRVANVGSQSFTLLGLVVTTAATPATAALTAFWNGTAWVAS